MNLKGGSNQPPACQVSGMLFSQNGRGEDRRDVFGVGLAPKSSSLEPSCRIARRVTQLAHCLRAADVAILLEAAGRGSGQSCKMQSLRQVDQPANVFS